MARDRIDFLSFGYRSAIRGLEDLTKLGEEVREVYGEEAYLQFDVGTTLAKDYCQKRTVNPITAKEIGNHKRK